MQGKIASLLGGLVKPFTDLYSNRQARIANESAAKANLDRIMAEAAANDAQVAGQIALVNAKNQNNTWKDEFALITIALPFWVAMVAGPLGFQDVVGQMFVQMSDIPEFWQETFQIGVLAALGITSIKKFFS
jgi:hypothetical protein